MPKLIGWLALLCLTFMEAGCSDSPTTQTLVVSWSANRERAVNVSGGGYKVYISQTKNFSIADVTPVDVPYVSGALAPTTVAVNSVAPGTYYIKIVAYSALALSGTSTSLPSSQFSVTVGGSKSK